MWKAIVAHFVKGELYGASNLYLALTTSKIREDLTPIEVFVVFIKLTSKLKAADAELGLR